ncbi:MAG: flagellar basal body L-ring protein FlgH [Alphaproteobacteria bacterium]
MMKSLSVLTAVLMLGGCGSLARLDHVGRPPALSPIANPVSEPTFQPVALPMPAPDQARYAPNSLWRAGATAFFQDQRASQVGDLLTVRIDITDRASLANTTTRNRTSQEDANLTNAFGIEGNLAQVLPEGVNPASLASFGSTTASSGTGAIDRQETVDLTVAAIVIQRLPNGNLVIFGRQEVRVNFEVRELQIMGVVRPEDISNNNTIAHTQIAEARVSYGGKGHITDLQQDRYLKQIYDIIAPF